MRKAINSIEDSPAVVPLFAFAVTGLIIAIGLFMEDLATSRAGYEALPTLKVNPWVYDLVALAPQVFGVIFGYYYLVSGKRWAMLIGAICFIVDVGTDVYYKSGSLSSGFGIVLLSIIESITLYTLFSEIAISVCFAICIKLLPFAIKQLFIFITGLIDSLRAGMDAISERDGGRGND